MDFKKFDKVFANYQPEPIPARIAEQNARIVDFFGWTKDDGPYPGVFLSRPDGHRCWWSVTWSGTHGDYGLNKSLLVEKMLPGQLMAEAFDYVMRPGADMNMCFPLAVHVLKILENPGDPKQDQIGKLGDLLRRVRQGVENQSYTAIFDTAPGVNPATGLPFRALVWTRERPGWHVSTVEKVSEK